MLTPKQASRRLAPIDQALEPELFKALSDPTRNQLLACLAKCKRPCSVSEVAECCSVDFSVVSRHLAILEHARIVDSVKQGRAVFYRVRYGDICRSLRGLADAFEKCRPIEDDVGTGDCCAKQ